MKQSQDNSPNEKPALLNNDDFVLLVESEFQNRGRPEDELSKKKVWDRLNSGLFSDLSPDILKAKHTRRSARLSLAIAALLVISLAPLLWFIDGREETRFKGTGTTPYAALHAYSIDNTGVLTATTGSHAQGTTLVFKVDTTQPLVLGLAMMQNSIGPKLAFISEDTAPGNGRILQQDGNTYGYKLEPEDRSIRFCVVAAVTKTALQQQLVSLDQTWRGLPAESCIEIVTF